MKNQYVELAEHLFELELERLSNDTEEHFQWNGWLDKFGYNSTTHVDDLTTKFDDVVKLSELLKEDFENGYWEDDGDFPYNYLMPDEYGGFITNCFERQLAIITKIGYQAEIIFN